MSAKRKASFFIIREILYQINHSLGRKAGFSQLSRLVSLFLRSERRLKEYLDLLSNEFGWLESFEETKSTPWTPFLTAPTRRWKVSCYRLSESGRQFLSLFPQDLALPLEIRLKIEVDDGIPTPEQQQRNYEEWLVSGPGPADDLE
ncbi:MAG TPA: hypothetical protein VJN71_07210 [Nitrososphaerales archaeon]|nr:hypothetical protein [Nitrososphaerales archaeon]